ncbi:hypothetical protein EV175_007251, partial [Coemansia sp. RSA 1933]
MAGVPIPIVTRAAAVAEQFERRVSDRQCRIDGGQNTVNGMSSPSSVLPVSLLSDFSNLLRMASLEGANNSPSPKTVTELTPEEVPVGGARSAKAANENQYWCCIVDHLRR